MKGKFLTLVAVSAVSLSSYSIDSKSSHADVKMAIVDMQRIEEEAKLSKSLLNKMQVKENVLRNDLMKRKSKVENDYRNLESKRSVLSREELEKSAKNLESDVQQLQRDEQVYSQTFDLSRVIALQEVQGYVQQAVGNYASEYDLIIPLNVVLHANKNKFDDITAKVLDRLNDISTTVDYEKAFKEAKEQVQSAVKSGNTSNIGTPKATPKKKKSRR